MQSAWWNGFRLLRVTEARRRRELQQIQGGDSFGVQQYHGNNYRNNTELPFIEFAQRIFSEETELHPIVKPASGVN